MMDNRSNVMSSRQFYYIGPENCPRREPLRECPNPRRVPGSAPQAAPGRPS